MKPIINVRRMYHDEIVRVLLKNGWTGVAEQIFTKDNKKIFLNPEHTLKMEMYLDGENFADIVNIEDLNQPFVQFFITH